MARRNDPPDRSAEDRALAAVTVRYLKRRPTRRMAPFNLGWFYGLHREIFGRVWRGGAGTPRTVEANFGVAPSRVNPALFELARDLAVWEGDPIDDAAELHWRAVQIHPFVDGNGRWARLLASIWVRQRGSGLLDWPLEVRQPRRALRDRYLDAIECAVRGDDAALKALHREWVRPWPARPGSSEPRP